MVDTVYTIGYTGFTVTEFINTLKANNISLVVDVRSQPYSQWFTDYNKEHLEFALKQNSIYYRNYSEEFGARQDNHDYYTKDGYLDFELFANSIQFRRGIRKLENSMKQGYCFVLMCAEKDPFNCHRTMLVARAFHESGYKVLHLMPEMKSITHKEIEERLLNAYYPNREQLSLFTEILDDEACLINAYRKRNAEIGYSIAEENE